MTPTELGMAFLEATWSVASMSGLYLVFLLLGGAVITTRPQDLTDGQNVLITLVDTVIMATGRFIVYGLALGGIIAWYGIELQYAVTVPIIITGIGVYIIKDIEPDAIPEEHNLRIKYLFISLLLIGSALAAIMIPLEGFGSLATAIILAVIFWRI